MKVVDDLGSGSEEQRGLVHGSKRDQHFKYLKVYPAKEGDSSIIVGVSPCGINRRKEEYG